MTLRLRERDLFDEGLALAKVAGRALYRQVFDSEPEQNPFYRTYRTATRTANYVRSRTEQGESLGSVLVGEAVSAIKSYGNRKAREYVPSFVKREFFDNYVSGFLNGKTYGAEIQEKPAEVFVNDQYVENGQTRRGSLGMWNYESGRKVVRVPQAQNLGALIGRDLTEADARAVQTYIKGHEVLEANPTTGPASDAEHAAFEARYLSSLERLARRGNELAREAYRGAAIVYRQRARNDRRFLEEVAQHFDVARLMETGV